MTKLDAVNEMLEALGEPPVSALETGLATDAGEAETILDRTSKRIQAQGWVQNTNAREKVTLTQSDVKIGATGGAGTFTFGETITESTSDATGVFNFEDGGYVYLLGASGTFTGGETLTGGSSGATRTGGTYTAITESKLAIGSDWLAVKPFELNGERQETRNIVHRGLYLYDMDNETFTFTAPVDVTRTIELDFTDLSVALAAMVVASAAVQFQRYKKRGSVDDAMLAQKLAYATVAAYNEDMDLAATNVTDTVEMRRITGNRNSTIFSRIGA